MASFFIDMSGVKASRSSRFMRVAVLVGLYGMVVRGCQSDLDGLRCVGAMMASMASRVRVVAGKAVYGVSLPLLSPWGHNDNEEP